MNSKRQEPLFRLKTATGEGCVNVTGLRHYGFLLLTAFLALTAKAEDHAGFLYDVSPLTLQSGTRTEVSGPGFYKQESGTQKSWGVPPLIMSYTEDPSTESKEFDFLYPVLTYDRYGEQHRWHIFQLFSFAGGGTQTETNRQRFTIFPIYFQQRSSDPAEDYTAVLPFYGRLQHRLFRDEVRFIMLPFYVQSRKRDVVTDNYVYPFFHLRHGNNLSGWQFWPLAAYEHKDVTLLTNNFGDIETVGGHDKRFLFWPIYYRELTGIGTPNPAEDLGVIPFYARLRSAKRDSTTWLWPLFSRVDDREKQYREWDLPWPLVVFAEGKGKNTTRVFPFYSHAASPTIESGFYLWPVYKYNTIHAAPLERQRHRVLFYLYNHTWERNTETGEKAHRKALWPLFEHKQDLKGNTRLQILAPLEPLIPDNRGIERGWSPLWSIWRSENNAQTGASSQSLLWNLYRRQATPKARTTSCLFGLFQYQSSDEGKRLRLFYVPFGKQPGKGGK